MKRLLFITLATLMLIGAGGDRPSGLPQGFDVHPENDYGGIGGGREQGERQALTHYPVIFVPDHGCDPLDWTGQGGRDSACAPCDVYGRFIEAGFSPVELWLLRVMPQGEPWHSIEEHTDDVRQFIFSVLRYTGAPKVQIVAHGAGAVLTLYAMKKYNLYNLVHATVLIAGPMHGTARCDWVRCLKSDPVCCSLNPGANLLKDMRLPHPTPYNVLAGRDRTTRRVKYMTLRNGRPGGDWWFPNNPDSPKLLGAQNRILPDQDHRGLRCSKAATDLILPFLSDNAKPCKKENDNDGDGFCSIRKGGNDCDDTNTDVFPGAPEKCGDAVDQDCNGADFNCETGRDDR